MRCDSKKISAYYDGQLSDEEHRQVSGHLQKCAQCAAVLASYRSITLGLRELPVGWVPRRLDAAIRARLNTTNRKNWTQSSFQWLSNLGSTAAAVLLAFGVAAVMVHNNGAVVESVQAFSPVDASVDVPVDTAIPISFSRPVDRTAVQTRTRLEPAAEVTYEWSDRQLVVRPKTELRADTEYKVIVAGMKDRTAPAVITFRTVPSTVAAKGSSAGLLAVEQPAIAGKKEDREKDEGNSARKSKDDRPGQPRVEDRLTDGGGREAIARAAGGSGDGTEAGSTTASTNASTSSAQSIPPPKSQVPQPSLPNGAGTNGAKQPHDSAAHGNASSGANDKASVATASDTSVAPPAGSPALSRAPREGDLSCGSLPHGRFAQIYTKWMLRERLGCPTSDEDITYVSEHPKGGQAIYRPDLRSSYWLRDDATWTKDVDGRASSGVADAPKNDSNGSPSSRQARLASVVDFQHGSLVLGPRGASYAIFRNGTWLDLSAGDKD